MTDPDETLDRFVQQRQDREIAGIKAEQTHETKLVRFVLRHLGKCKGEESLVAKFTGKDGALSFAAFHEVFPDFPIVLRSTKLNGIKLHVSPRALFPSLMMRFASAPFVKPFLVAQAENKRGCATGLIFPRKGIGSDLILHDAVSLLTVGTCMLGQVGNQRLCLEPFKNFLEALRQEGDF